MKPHRVLTLQRHTNPSRRIVVMVDGGVGLSQQFDVQLGILGGESDMDTRSFAPSAAARVHLACELGRVGDANLGLALSGDSRSTLDENRALALGVGLGLVVRH